jgi:LCP family protein required for cell wall assembly
MSKNKIDRWRILAILVIIVAVVFFYLNIFFPRQIPNTFRIGTIRQPINVLLLGIDLNYDSVTRKAMTNVEGRTDTMIFVHLDPIHGQINLLSIPRDTYAAIPGYGMTKINAANVYGGAPLVKETVGNFLQKPVDYFLKVDIGTLIDLVDSLGGVTLYVEKDMRYVDRASHLDINLKQGWQKLSGEKAHEYIRFRHDAEGDIGRIQRQQNFIRALLLALIRPSNIIKAPYAISSALRELKTDLSAGTLIRIANFARMARIKTWMISGEAANVESAGSVWVPEREELKKTLRENF